MNLPNVFFRWAFFKTSFLGSKSVNKRGLILSKTLKYYRAENKVSISVCVLLSLSFVSASTPTNNVWRRSLIWRNFVLRKSIFQSQFRWLASQKKKKNIYIYIYIKRERGREKGVTCTCTSPQNIYWRVHVMSYS